MSIKSLSNTPYQWCEKSPRITDGLSSHTRLIHINLQCRWVVKIETAEIRKERITPLFPYGEEIAYKVCKLFHWDTVPKSKVLHQNALQSLGSIEKIQKYEPLVKCFEKIKGSKTFTFQTFVEGETLPNHKNEITQSPDLGSYQRAYLLWLILGKSDDRGDNVVFDPRTRKLYGIDNEYIGSVGYEKNGILNCFEDLKKVEIDPSILEDILKVSEEGLKKIQNKYMVKDLNLLALWAKESISISLFDTRKKTQNLDIVKAQAGCDRRRVNTIDMNPLAVVKLQGSSYGPNSEFWSDCKSASLPISMSSSESGEESNDDQFFIDNTWETIFNNFKLLQKEIVLLREKGKTITIETLEFDVSVAHKSSSSLDEFPLQF